MATKEEYLASVKYEQYIEDGKLYFHITEALDSITEFVYHLFCGRTQVLEHKRTAQRQIVFQLSQAGQYRVKFFVITSEGKCSAFASVLTLEENTDMPLLDLTFERAAEAVSLNAYSSDPFFDNYSEKEARILLGIDDDAYYVPRYDGQLQNLLNGRIGTLDISLPFSWNFQAVEDRFVPYNMHAFRYIVCLLTEYLRTGAIKYRDMFLAYILDWVEKHPKIDLSDTWAWHDDATARRVYFFTVALLMFNTCLTEEQIQAIKTSLRMQARLLTKEVFYKYHHNHGMYQDRGLALYALCFSDEPEYHLLLAKERTWEYFQFSMTDEGVHKEHAPMYHLFIARSVYWFSVAYRLKDLIFTMELDELLDKMASYAAWITLPDGTIPSIGDSSNRNRLVDFWLCNDAYRYTATFGTEGTAPKNTLKVYPQGGYGILRKDWRMDPQNTWMMLLAATHSIAHKHHDDLSFL